MPDQIAHFRESCRVYEQVKASKTTEEKTEGQKTEGQKTSDGPEDTVDERGGKRGGPKKSFRWTEEIRECLWHVLEGKLDNYRKNESQELEEHLKTLLDSEVKPLWPKGWMQSRVLMRESRNVLSLFQPGSQKKGKGVKKRPATSGPPVTLLDGCRVLQESPAPKDVSWEADRVCIEGSEASSCISSGAMTTDEPALKKMEAKTRVLSVDTGSPAPAAPHGPQATSAATATPTQSLLDLLADQALAQVPPLSLPQELLAAAVAKCKHSVQHWSFAADTRSPPLPPPPPQSSPVGFPGSGLCKVAFPQLQQMGDFARHVESTEMAAASETDI